MSTNQNPDPASEEARRINAAAAAVDCRLEVALEGVLIRYGIPAYLEVACGADRPHVLRENADRGDLSSDLATVAREATVERFASGPFLLMNDDATVTALTRCTDCGFLFRDIEQHVRESVTVPGVTWADIERQESTDNG